MNEWNKKSKGKLMHAFVFVCECERRVLRASFYGQYTRRTES